MRTISLGTMIQQLSGLLDTNDLSHWEQTFIASMVEHTGNGSRTSHLSEPRVEKIEQIYRKHFA